MKKRLTRLESEMPDVEALRRAKEFDTYLQSLSYEELTAQYEARLAALHDPVREAELEAMSMEELHMEYQRALGNV